MPELPEVEIARRNLDRWAGGRRVLRVEAPASRIFGATRPAIFAERLAGATYRDSERRGKNLVARLTRSREEIALRVHLGMTGKLLRRSPKDEAPRFSRATLFLSGGVAVHYSDVRFFGQLEAGPWKALRDATFAGLGPDPIEDAFDGAILEERLAGTKAPVKVALLDQARVAGVGNIHASESLWRARILPFRPANALSAAEYRLLAKSILASFRHTLDEEDADEIVYVEEAGAPNPFRLYDREGESCPRCRHRIARVVQASRSTFYCKGCQR